MAQKTWVRADEKQAILESAGRLIEDKIDVTAKALIEEMEATTDYPRRGVDTIGNLLAEWRKEGTLPPAKANTPPGEQINPQEEIWSIGAASPQWVPYEVLPTVGKLREWCLVIGRKLTIRQAKWAGILSRLSPISSVNGLSAWKLYSKAIEYARREWACEQLGRRTVNTTDLDSRLILRWWLKDVATMTGELPEQHTSRALKRKEEQFGPGDQDFLAWRASLYVAFRLNLGREVEYSLLDGLSEDADWLFAMLLRHMAKGPKWESMGQEERVSIANRLLVFAKETAKEIESLHTGRDPFGRDDPALLPNDLFKEVGYDN